MHTAMPLARSEVPVAGGALGEPLLAVRNVGISFGGIIALDDVSFDLSEGHILGLIGPNGAGKTTLFNCVSRLYTPDRGAILFEGQDILGKSANRIAGIGIARTFQNLALFRTMSVFDNVRVGGHSLSKGGQLIVGLVRQRGHDGRIERRTRGPQQVVVVQRELVLIAKVLDKFAICGFRTSGELLPIVGPLRFPRAAHNIKPMAGERVDDLSVQRAAVRLRCGDQTGGCQSQSRLERFERERASIKIPPTRSGHSGQ